MFHSHCISSKINRLHEGRLPIIVCDKKSTFIGILGKDNSVSIHKRNLRFLAIEMFKFKRGLAPAPYEKMIPQNRQNRYKLQNNVNFTLPLVKSVQNSLDTIQRIL